ncbi:hypothetical protein L3X38_030219 [Prunus dulcis]|uniref:Uncharacterized protein n=1 Tax=Prunus dulcis TaxID=3755 RepID=A0AAD4VAW9_PRUDU|nr:hypothetical protein L3X38_030219 [Prunus dulcis]
MDTNGWDAKPAIRGFAALGETSLVAIICSFKAVFSRWDFGFRRNLNELEIAEVARLLDLLEGVRLVTSTLNKRRWKLDLCSLFSCLLSVLIFKILVKGRLSLLTLKFGKPRLLRKLRRIFEDYKGVGVVELWDRVKFWAALWASTSLAFKDISYPTIMRNPLAVVS